jgi:hypothetical protein
MASTKASNAKTAWQYQNDRGDATYTIQAKTAYVLGGDAAAFGGQAAIAGDISIPNGYKPRRVKVVSSAKVIRWPIVYDVAATLWTTAGTTVTLDILGVDTVMTSDGTRRPEKAERKATLVPA